MHKVVVATTTRVGSFGSANFNLAVALRHTVDRAGMSHTDKFRFVIVELSTESIEHIHWVSLNHSVEHILDFIRTDTLVSDDKRVETNTVQELQPCHVELRCGGATPLTRLQENKANRLASQTQLFKPCHKATLRTSEPEEHILATALVLDIDI